jgi:hypothetical protein
MIDLNKSPEQQTIVNNIKALVEELAIIDNAEQTIEETKKMKSTDTKKMEDVKDKPPKNEEEISKMEEDKKDEMKEDKKDDKKEKTLIETSSDGSTANDSAGARDEGNTTDVMDENVQAVAKAMLELMKSQNKEPKKEETPLEKIAKSIEKIVDRQAQLEQTVESVLKGFGVAELIEKENEVKKTATEKKQIRSTEDIEKLLGYLAQNVKKSETTENYYSGQANEVRKSLPIFLKNFIKEDK